MLRSDLLSCWNREQAGDDGWTGEMFLGMTEWTHVLQTVDEHFLLLSHKHTIFTILNALLYTTAERSAINVYMEQVCFL